MTASPSRPVLRWHGGKWMVAPWIISHFPPHDIYVEPFGGAASVLLRKRASKAEVYNDLFDQVYNLFRVLRSEDAHELVRQLSLTPFSRSEYDLATSMTDDPVESARRLIVRSFQGFGSNSAITEIKSGFRASSTRSGSTPAQDWSKYPPALIQIIKRLQGVTLENRPALKVIQDHDSPNTLHYLDPPYVHSTRDGKGRGGAPKHSYRFEMDNQQHAELLETAKSLTGMVVLSGYSNPLYAAALSDWERFEKTTFADGARPRVEVIWKNANCRAAEAQQDWLVQCG